MPSAVLVAPNLPSVTNISKATTNISKTTSKRTKLKRLGARYWRRLMRVGVPQAEAKELAIAVLRYNHLACRPSFEEKRLIVRYCQHLCAVGLWHLELLLGS